MGAETKIPFDLESDEITPEMIEAGVSIVESWNSRYETTAEVVIRLFQSLRKFPARP